MIGKKMGDLLKGCEREQVEQGQGTPFLKITPDVNNGLRYHP